ncbi:hypothetical protein [Kineosporia sp. A_224]|uniref:hypothetical protein n=1 Tax=Kineosporia sp. A_224 TaxID=1962180 RepID=UPI00117AC3A3|nr:hypothetical protein [Kineosporia sp. A_224]
MTHLDDLRAEFEAFREETRAALGMRASIDVDQDSARRATATTVRTLDALACAATERLDIHAGLLRDLACAVGLLPGSTAGAGNDLAALRAEVAEVRSGQAAILRILEERLPG